MRSVGDMNSGETGVISGFSHNMDLQSRLVEMGILPGVMIRVIKWAPWRGSVQLQVRDYHVSIRREDAVNIYVKSTLT
jgi:Fe2+ transport system protein FeoA